MELLSKIHSQKPKTRERQIAEWRANIPNLYNGAYKKIYDKALSGKSLRAAITANCQECMCWQGIEVKNCDVVTCPLHPYRPGHRRQGRPMVSNLAQQRACGAVDSDETLFEGSSGPQGT